LFYREPLKTSVFRAALYLFAIFVFSFLAVGTLDGAGAALRSIPAYVRAPFGFFNWQFDLVTAVWILAAGIVYTLAVSFISSRTKSLIAAFGISLIVLFINVGLSALGITISQMIEPLVDFGFSRITLAGEIFNAYKVYKFFGIVVPYYFKIILFMVLLTGLMCLGMYIGQKRRNAV
jgi:hypothetical protein